MIYLSEQDYNLQKEEEQKKLQEQFKRSQKPSSVQRIEKPKSINEESKYVKGVVKFSNISVRNLPKMDIGGKADPFVIFRMENEEKKTTIAKNTLNYDYTNESYELIYDPLIMKGNGKADIDVYDYDSITGNDLIGITNVDILPSLNKQIQVELFLQPQKGKKDQNSTRSQSVDQGLGKVIFNMLYTPEQEWIQKNKDESARKLKEAEEMKKNLALENARKQEQERLKQESEKKKQELERKKKEALDSKYIKGFVKFNNISVRNLPNTDVIGKPDPYVLIRMGMDEKQTSVAHNVNDYDYLNEKYEMEYDPVKMKGKKEVDIEVWDYDTAGFDDLVGSASVDV
ncbi:MAG: hypothetical protein EZS28_043152 [Streblomastix strix]|uniref:C2 domain-containing protein n=1 Tax=Streblomastix strix TaxID=222440 RepID=A0A5J4TUT4_9EUKA|nr:MAG: hypothetical protein EZS28_043152 [Streblomastix strix]